MIKKIFLGIIAVLSIVLVVYLVMSSMLINPIDKSVVITPPMSSKSASEEYAFGFQPKVEYTEQRATCAEQSATKKAYFGDLHIHTALSADAYPDGTRTMPDDVYRFAKGGRINLPTPEGAEQRTLKLARPLDFAAITDHSETFGEGYICRTEGAFEGYHSSACKIFRAGGESGVREFMAQNARLKPQRNSGVCGADMKDCQAADKIVWDSIIASAEQAYDRDESCSFTSLVGYEYTRSINAQHLHRNAIFRNADVPNLPASFFSHPTPFSLLESYETDCRAGIKNCDVISIPHNSNISGGNAFNPVETAGFDIESQQANRALRNSFDRLMEITQHKGASECLNGVTDVLGDVDELCNVEAIRQFGKKEYALELNARLPKFGRSNSPECRAENFDDIHNLYKGFCLSSRDFARGALLAGMQEQQSHGINPYQTGFIGSSDTHVGASGATDETNWQGHIAYEGTLAGRLGDADLGRFNRLVSNPGGLAGVYAVENSRDALFHSMKRREAFGTSGTRIQPRFFAGRFNDNICNAENWLEQAYANGTPMGSSLPAIEFDFQFVLQATADSHSQPLTKLQLVKGWIDVDGKRYNKVIDVIQNEGAAELCAVYTDPEYDPNVSNYYYLRAVEAPSQRWSTLQCDNVTEQDKFEQCTNTLPKEIVEMAWSSPIWLSAQQK